MVNMILEGVDEGVQGLGGKFHAAPPAHETQNFKVLAISPGKTSQPSFFGVQRCD